MRTGTRYFTQTEMHLLLLILLFFVFVARTFDLAVDTCLKSAKCVIRFHLIKGFACLPSYLLRPSNNVCSSGFTSPPAKTLHYSVFVTGRKTKTSKQQKRKNASSKRYLQD